MVTAMSRDVCQETLNLEQCGCSGNTRKESTTVLSLLTWSLLYHFLLFSLVFTLSFSNCEVHIFLHNLVLKCLNLLED